MQTLLDMDFSIAEHAADSIFITDTEAHVVYQNPEARRMFRLSDQELYGQRVIDKIAHQYPEGNPDTLEQCKVYRAATYGETARDFIWRVYRADGSPFYVSCTASPHYNKEGIRVGAVFFATDITARRNAEEALVKSTEKLQLAIEAAELGMFDYFPQTTEVVWSEKMREHFGLPSDSIINSNTFYLGLHADDRERIRSIIEEASRPGAGGRYQVEFRTIGLTDGQQRWIFLRGQVHFDADGNAIRRVGVTVDITEKYEAEKRLQVAAQHDSLTGLPNRALLFEYCEHLLAQAERIGANSAVLFVDLDRFKPINDLYGHEVGDKVLQEVARRLLHCTRKEDVVSRLGGDEFIVVLPRVHGSQDPETVAQHILETVARPIPIDSLQVAVSPSIGISLFRKHAEDLAGLIRCADLAMYAAKRAGRNTFRIYMPEHQQFAIDKVQLEQQLKDALDANKLTLLYQPVIDIATGQVVGAEALIRLADANGTLLSPDQFIPIAESAGLIDRLGLWVAREACRQQQHWQDTGLSIPSMAINVSASQFRHPEFASRITQTIDESGMDPTCLEIELTESTVMDNITEAIAKLTHLKSRGVRIVLDDVGTGYSNLSHLSNLPLDKLKIDRSFTDQLESNESSQSIADTIIGLGRALNLEVVGEGIESEGAMRYLRHHGCDQAQGYLFSKPLSAHDFESWYRAHDGHCH
ncbi:EAL domain-containing protein [Noviherbaspirillum saxi]|nr:EAL domain-containing protein [Noviherbaspirillum saxi]